MPKASDTPMIEPRRVKEQEVAVATREEFPEESHVYVHCHFHNTHQDMLIRIWRTTYLVDQGSGSRSSLVHVENITLAPQWTMIPNHQTFSFLLIFASLPKSCTVFDLLEDIPQAGGFHVPAIARNEKDVYHVWL